ncbi:hypothetical protein [Streptomyces sp. H27-D2]|uniref:hypothetical protein n=1 Tax=Streptomyces sp. H27-D2 TaxID=3046304 RepID=UPI002DB980E5|nr:hypothetical protein [Streptomyces sp. H27-D2]MEC4017962.1 hypothetical protein [Streptomyces sp. H27-D2]
MFDPLQNTAATPQRISRTRRADMVSGRHGPAGGPTVAARQYLAAVGDDWSAAKLEYYGSPEAKEIMWSLVHFRKWYVDAKLLELRATFSPLRIRSVGSVTLTSDYDITVSGPEDVAAVEWFNDTFRRDWGKESATVFDTNLYVKDFMPERSNFGLPAYTGSTDAPGGRRWGSADRPRTWRREAGAGEWDPATKPRLRPEPEDTEIGRPAGVQGRAAVEFDQDVAALTKQRKYMTQDEWDGYLRDLVRRMTPGKRGTATIRYRMADGVHTRAVADLAAQVAQESGSGRLRCSDQEFLDSFEHSAPDVVVRARNKVYTRLARQVRATQAAYAGSPTDELAVLAREQTSYALWHAMEAYHSEGAVRHVVGGQAGSGISVSAAQYLQSFNEQLGDLLKDMTHYQESGEAFYQSSKYLMRMADAAKRALDASNTCLGDEDLALLEQLHELGHDEHVLIRMRKNKDRFDGMPVAEKSRIATGEYGHALAIRDKDALRRRVLELGAEINARVRTGPA